MRALDLHVREAIDRGLPSAEHRRRAVVSADAAFGKLGGIGHVTPDRADVAKLLASR